MKQTSKKNGTGTFVKVHAITPTGIALETNEGDFFLSYSKNPWFRDAKVSDVFNVEMCCGDEGIRWDALDVDLEMESLKHPEKYPLVMKRRPEEVL
jgi:hypothetical protein